MENIGCARSAQGNKIDGDGRHLQQHSWHRSALPRSIGSEHLFHEAAGVLQNCCQVRRRKQLLRGKRSPGGYDRKIVLKIDEDKVQQQVSQGRRS